MAKASASDLAEMRSGKASARDRAEAGGGGRHKRRKHRVISRGQTGATRRSG